MNQNQCPHLSLNSSITYSIQGKPLYKDECTKCYENQKSEKGVDVCLSCFNGGCKTELFNHSNLHSSQTNHPIVLNLKKVLVKKEETEKVQPQITKLAIGKPGGIDFSNETWEQQCYIYCNVCKINIDYTQNTKLKELVTSIVNMASVNEQGAIVAWEEELYPCEHTLTINQEGSGKVGSKLAMHCSQCELSSNLWLCLTCGNLGCGRKNHDGSGGNGHALSHFEAHKTHSLAVKTGTITPDGGASVYCYTCNNEVIDDAIAKHLGVLGIDIKDQRKTEKSVTEMNLDFNLNFTLSKTIEDGVVMKNLYGSGFTGLNNLGNSCYMNSVIQVLFSLESFQAKYFDTAMEHLLACKKVPADCYLCQLSKIMYGLYSGAYSEKKIRLLPEIDGKREEEDFQEGIYPNSFKNYFAQGHKDFTSNKQQDASEYLFHVIEIFEKNEKQLALKNCKNDFTFDLETRLECETCHAVKYSMSRTYFLPFLVPGWETKKDKESKLDVQECIKHFIGTEKFQANCDTCKNKNIFYSKTQRVINFPKYLIITLQRFVFDWTPIKLETQFEFPKNNINLEVLNRTHNEHNENVVEVKEEDKKESDEEDYPFNTSALNTLISNGVPETSAKQALFNTGNSDVDAALTWFYMNLENPHLNDPVPKIKKKSQSRNSFEVNTEHLANLVSFGYEEGKAKYALKKCKNNFEQALEMFFTNPDFEVIRFITHLGVSTSSGHYVCHILKNKEWIYYNDARVTSCDKPPFEKGFIYFFKNEKA